MTKKELVNKVASDTKVSKQDTGMMVDAITKAIIDELAVGGRLQLPGLGTFSVGTFSGHTRKLPQGDTVSVPEQRRVHFKAAKGLKEKMNPT